MKQFDHLSIFVSIIITLGFRHIILLAISMINLRGKVKIYYPTLVWMMFLLFFQLHIWWVFYYRHELTDWRFFGFVYYLMIPIMASMLSYLLLPEVKPETDMEGLYFHNRKWFFGLIGFAAATSLNEYYILTWVAISNVNFWIRILFVVLSLVGLFNGSKRLQLPLALSFMLLLIVYIGLLFIQLG